MKKIICALLCLAMLCTALPLWAAADDMEEAVIYGAEERGLLQSLGILKYTAEELPEPLSRGEFFQLVCAVANYGALDGVEPGYGDLAADSAYVPAVAMLSAMGIISGNAYGQIYPDRIVTAQEAVSVLVKVLGHGYPAEQSGGYPYGYLTIANRIKLMSGLDIGAETELTKGMAVRLLYNALEAERLVQSSFDGADFIKLEAGDTLLHSVHETRRVTGVLEAVDITRLMGENDVDGFCIQIEGLTLSVYDIRNIYDYLGYHVDVYYRELLSEKYDNVVYICKTGKNAETVINVEDVIDIGGSAVVYGDSALGKRRKAGCINGVPVLYNGAATKRMLSMSMISGRQGVLRLLDNNGDGSADVVFADLYDNYVVGYADSKSYTLYDKHDNQKTIVLDIETDDPYTVLYDEKGKEISIDNLTAGSVLSVYQSASDAYQQYIRGYHVSDTIEGDITVLEDGGKYITVNDVRYRTNGSCAELSNGLLRPGAHVRLHLDVMGNVVYADSPADDGMTYAFIMAAAMSVTSFERRANLKLYTQNDEIISAFAAETLTLDGVKLKRTDKRIMQRLHDASVAMFGDKTPDNSYSSMVRITRNDNGEINTIDTIYNGETEVLTLRDDERCDQDALFMLTSTDAEMLYYSTRTIGTQIALANVSTTNLMYYPSPVKQNMLDESLYGSTTSGQVLRDNQPYALSAFYTNSNESQVQLLGMVYNEDVIGRLDNNSSMAVISGIGYGMDAEGERQLRLKVLSNGAESKLSIAKNAKVTGAANTGDESISAEMTPEQLKVGDVIFYTTNLKKEAVNLYLYYRAETETMVQNTGSVYANHRAFARGFVHSRLNNGFFVYYTDDENPALMAGVQTKDCQLASTVANVPSYYRCTTLADGKIKAEVVTADALRSYKETGSDCSRVIMHRYYGRPQSVVILEKEE